MRQFQRDVMLECLRNYDLDGIHLDYIRSSGQGMCLCSTCQTEVQKRFGIPPLAPENPSFPLALQLSANPLDKPDTAQVLARCDSGVPAIASNRLGAGETVLLNWTAVHSDHPARTALAQRFLERLGAVGGAVYQVRGQQTLETYGAVARIRPRNHGLRSCPAACVRYTAPQDCRTAA